MSLHVSYFMLNTRTRMTFFCVKIGKFKIHLIRAYTKMFSLNARWAQLRDMVDQKRAELDKAHRLETFRIDCQETVTWIEDKTRVLEDADTLTNDLSGVMKLQRRWEFFD